MIVSYGRALVIMIGAASNLAWKLSQHPSALAGLFTFSVEYIRLNYDFSPSHPFSNVSSSKAVRTRVSCTRSPLLWFRHVITFWYSDILVCTAHWLSYWPLCPQALLNIHIINNFYIKYLSSLMFYLRSKEVVWRIQQNIKYQHP